MLLHNGNIYTQDPAKPHADCIWIERGRIVAVGQKADLLAGLPSTIETCDLHGQDVIPGLIDSHLHLELYAAFLHGVDCETTTRVECLGRIQNQTRLHPKDIWITGHGWNHNIWPEGIGDRTLLDEICSEKPAYFTSKSVHSGWANSAALQLAGIDENTPDPAGGVIVRDPQGKPTGILLEKAMLLVERIIPQPDSTQLKAMLAETLLRLAQFGITSVHDFDSAHCFSALQELMVEDRLPIRVVKGIPFETFDAAIQVGLHTGFGNDHLRIGSLKLFADGALGSQTAAMLAPYEGTSDRYGIALLSPRQLIEIGEKAVSNGFSVAVHAIGDAANRNVISAFERIRTYEKQHGIPARAHRIEHVQCIHPADINRMAAAGITASMQPTHALSDWSMAEKHWGSRVSNSYTWQSIAQAGIPLIFGSDAPVETPDPWLGLHAAVNRLPDGYKNEAGWQPQEKLTLTQALTAFTSAPAEAIGAGQRLGRLRPGCLADLVVLDRDIFTSPVELLRSTRTLATMVAGTWVWRAE